MQIFAALETRMWHKCGYEWWEDSGGCERESIRSLCVPGESCSLLLVPAAPGYVIPSNSLTATLCALLNTEKQRTTSQSQKKHPSPFTECEY